MDEREELAALRRLAELEAKAGGVQPEATYGDRLKSNTKALGREVRDVGAGLLRGAGSVGNAIFTLNTMGQIGSYADRAQGMTDALGTLGADTNSAGFKGGKLGGEIAGTAGAGGVLAGGAKAAGAVPEVVNALRTGGFTVGPTQRGAMDALAIRSLGGAATGGATVGLASPDDAGTGAAIGAALPGAMKAVGYAGGKVADGMQAGARGLMESALKGTIKAHQKGDVDTAVQTLLDYGINPTNAGVQKIKGLVGELNDKIADAIKNSGATIDKNKVLNALARSRKTAANQVSPTSDLAAIRGVGDDFAQSFPGPMSVQQAQSLKQGTYRNLAKKYGEQGSATTEAQKDLARGLKDEVAAAVPEVVPLNAAESKLLTTLKVAERRAMMDVNKNPISLDAAFALASGNPVVALGLLANSKAGTKATIARGINALSRAPSKAANALAGPAAYRSLPRAGDLDTGHR